MASYIFFNKIAHTVVHYVGLPNFIFILRLNINFFFIIDNFYKRIGGGGFRESGIFDQHEIVKPHWGVLPQGSHITVWCSTVSARHTVKDSIISASLILAYSTMVVGGVCRFHWRTTRDLAAVKIWDVNFLASLDNLGECFGTKGKVHIKQSVQRPPIWLQKWTVPIIMKQSATIPTERLNILGHWTGGPVTTDGDLEVMQVPLQMTYWFPSSFDSFHIKGPYVPVRVLCIQGGDTLLVFRTTEQKRFLLVTFFHRYGLIWDYHFILFLLLQNTPVWILTFTCHF